MEATYAKGLSKLGGKLTKACSRDQGTHLENLSAHIRHIGKSIILIILSNNLGGNSAGGVNEAWRCIGEEMDAAAEAHRVWGLALGEQLAKPLRVRELDRNSESYNHLESII